MSPRVPGFAYDTPGGYRGLQCVQKDLQLDKAKVTATGVYVSSNPDRVGDVIEVAGVKTENHQRNPIALLDHGRFPLPIGRTMDEAGKYLIELKPEEGVGVSTTVFSQRIPEAIQVYALIDEGMLRAQSIGFRVLKSESIREENRYLGEHILECEMLETSWTALPCNPDAVRAILSNGVLTGSNREQLLPVLRKSLLPFAAPARAWANGATLEKRTMPDEKKKAPQGAAETKGAPPAKAKAEDTAAAPPGKEDEAKAGEEEETKDDDTVQEPHGAQVLRAMHQCMAQAVEQVEALMGPLENDDVKALAETHLESFKAAMGEVEEAFAASYPKLDLAGTKADDEESEEEEPEEKDAEDSELEQKDDDEEEAEEKVEDDDDDEEKSDDSDDDDEEKSLTPEERREYEQAINEIEAQVRHKKRLLAAAV